MNNNNNIHIPYYDGTTVVKSFLLSDIKDWKIEAYKDQIRLYPDSYAKCFAFGVGKLPILLKSNSSALSIIRICSTDNQWNFDLNTDIIGQKIGAITKITQGGVELENNQGTIEIPPQTAFSLTSPKKTINISGSNIDLKGISVNDNPVTPTTTGYLINLKNSSKQVAIGSQLITFNHINWQTLSNGEVYGYIDLDAIKSYINSEGGNGSDFLTTTNVSIQGSSSLSFDAGSQVYIIGSNANSGTTISNALDISKYTYNLYHNTTKIPHFNIQMLSGNTFKLFGAQLTMGTNDTVEYHYTIKTLTYLK
jgi:hypothetical protein